MRAQEPIAFLTERLAAVERERDALQRLQLRTERLEELQRAFVKISAARDEVAIASEALRGARLALGFKRALWFSVGVEGEASAIHEIDSEVEPMESDYGDSFPEGSSLVRTATGASDVATGYAGDPDMALYDVRGWYVLAAMRAPGGTAAILYADDKEERSIETWSANALGELAAHAGLALENVRLRAELERLALYDPLTGLLNRRALASRLEVELARARRTHEPLCFAMIDVDDFKRINDTRGHAGGDAALVAFARAMRETTRATDVPARFAGDEFALLMPNTDRSAADIVMTRLYGAIREAGLAASTGLAFASRDIADQHTLFIAADTALYAAKHAGKNTWRFGAT
jgi:diguanylate cyclase (GGDEF)-like protein